MARREFKGNAARTRLSTGIGAADTSFNINSNSGWPTGGANGAFSVILDPDAAGIEEHVLVTNQSGGACTGVTRGVGDTVAVAHAVGADGSVIHGTTRLDYDEANRHLNVTTDDDHTQYMKTDGTRHDLTARHAYGAAMGTRPVPIAVGTTLLAGTSAQFAAGDHQHTIGVGAINASNMFAAGVVDAGAIGASAVGSSELAASAVIAGKIAAAAIDDQSLFSTDTQPFIVQSADPGAVGANKVWFDTTARIIKIRNAGNSGWDIYGQSQTDWAEYNPVFGGVTLGTGGYDWGYWRNIGDFVYVTGGFELGTGGDVTSGIDVTLPVNARNPSLAVDVNNRFRWEGAARAQSGAALWAGIGVIAPSVDATKINTFATAGSNGWTSTDPFNWAVGDRLVFFIAYEPA